ncbi:Oxidoreductase BOA17 [Fusarium oxysporum f. sp. cubense]|uniref:Oxidoreductase BOA17 n=1 Tax=Fusarium oxysporum f. sp. cubense TaxID=61366 RepID=A0A559KY96_FUSOC|nr:Oxidoreductase BOA17 [Fusarium oxysporum f. sp. cubense]
MTTPVWFITGSSNGLGLLLSLRVLKAGHRVIATVRDTTRSADAVRQIEEAGGKIVTIDLTESKASITKKVQDAEKAYGRIDFLVNNAGYCWKDLLPPLFAICYVCIELFTEAEAEHQIQTNLFGPLYTIQAALPGMRSRGSGTIINISSIAGQDAQSSCGLYSASKFALEGLSESLSKEVKEFGINVLLVEPGAFRTNFLEASIKSNISGETAYQGTLLEATLQKFEKAAGKQPGDPNKAVDIIFEVATGEGAAGDLKGKVLRLPLGKDCFARLKTKLEFLQHDIEATREIGITTDLD